MGTVTIKYAKAGGRTRHERGLQVRRGNTLDIDTITTSGISAKGDVGKNTADAADDMICTITTDTAVYIKVGNDTGLTADNTDFPLAPSDDPLEVSLGPGENIAAIDQ